jgi:hypothetical protein
MCITTSRTSEFNCVSRLCATKLHSRFHYGQLLNGLHQILQPHFYVVTTSMCIVLELPPGVLSVSKSLTASQRPTVQSQICTSSSFTANAKPSRETFSPPPPSASRKKVTSKSWQQYASSGASLSQAQQERMQQSRLKRIVAPAGTPSAIIRPGFGESSDNFISIIMGNVSVHLFRSVTTGTLSSYQVGFNAWLEYCSLGDISDPFLSLSSCPSSFLQESIAPADFPAYAVAGFVDYLYTGKGLQPPTVFNYVSGVRHQFKSTHKDLAPFSDSVVQSVKKAISISFMKYHLASDTSTLPWTTDLIVFADKTYLDLSKWQDRAFSICTKLAFTCLARRSEVLVTADAHYIKACDVVFMITFPSGNSVWVVSSLAHKYKAHRQYVTKAAFTFASAKNDQDGSGHRYSFDRLFTTDPDVAFDLVIDAFDWACLAQPKQDDAFLSYRGKESLSYSFVLKTIKAIAASKGLDPVRYKLHSMRVGGASTLAAAGKPDHYIQKMGRWKSLAFLGYIRTAVRTINESFAALVNPLLFTSEHVKQLNPGAIWA